MKSFVQIIETLRLLDDGTSFREIREKVDVGNGTISKWRGQFNELPITLDQLECLNGEEIMALFYPEGITDDQPSLKPDPDYETVYKNVTARKAPSTIYKEWELYREEYPNGYSYSQFRRKMNAWMASNRGARNLTMALNRVPGECVYIDWLCQAWHNQSYAKKKVMRSS